MNFEEFYHDYGIRKLEAGEHVTTFSCGDEDLDDFIINDAPLYRDALYRLYAISVCQMR